MRSNIPYSGAGGEGGSEVGWWEVVAEGATNILTIGNKKKVETFEEPEGLSRILLSRDLELRRLPTYRAFL